MLDELDLVDAAITGGTIGALEADDLTRVDFVVRGVHPESGKVRLLVCEVSRTVHDRDVERAARRAEVLRKVGYDAVPLVGGENITDRLREKAEAEGVIVDIREPAA